MKNGMIGSGFRMGVATLLAVGLLATAGCSTNDGAIEAATSTATVDAGPAANPTGTGETKTVAIDNTVGATIALSDGAAITVPAGALPAGVDAITITSSTSAAPADYAVVSPVYAFGPEGTVFLAPVSISFPVAFSGTDTSDLTVLWSRQRSDGYDMVPTTFTAVDGKPGQFVAAAAVTHFSSGMVGHKYTSDPRPSTDPYAH
jgi:hypothetical protein